jgi:hypothetical protein
MLIAKEVATENELQQILALQKNIFQVQTARRKKGSRVLLQYIIQWKNYSSCMHWHHL